MLSLKTQSATSNSASDPASTAPRSPASLPSPATWRHASWAAYLHPLSLTSLGLLLLNDHLLKPLRWPSAWITGKLSDLCGMVFFPLLLNLLLCLAISRLPPQTLSALTLRRLALHTLLSACALSAALLSAINLSVSARWHYIRALSVALPWVFPPHRPPHVTADPTDLLALPILSITFYIGYLSINRALPLNERLPQASSSQAAPPSPPSPPLPPLAP
jgi:hypothetical protein